MQYAKESSRTVCFEPDGTIDVKETSLALPLRDSLSKMGISSLFEMQEKVLSHILNVSTKRLIGDVILCAPTGSGKTLAYALPVVQSMLGRKIPRLRAIIVVPTRDLAIQVSKVFEGLTEDLGITVGVISGASSISAESSMLAKTEILIATPGRLVDHMENNDGLSVRAVRYLVIDESDRLLQESYQNWIESVLPVLGNRQGFSSGFHQSDSEPGAGYPTGMPTTGILAMAIHPKVSALSFTRSSEASEENVHKILVSATQTKNPKRLVRLGLRRPTFFEPLAGSRDTGSRSDSGYSVPSTLTESGWVVPDINDKPTALMKILGWMKPGELKYEQRKTKKSLSMGGVQLIFTKSVEAAHRLCRLLQLAVYRLGVSGDVLEMSGELSPKRREEVLRIIRTSATTKESISDRFLIVVCSDVLARGMDMINVDSVINYDVPIHIRTYLHRAGRTARAGRTGKVVTLLLSKQAHHFRAMVREAERGKQKVLVQNLAIKPDEQAFFIPILSQCLALLRRVLVRENLGLLFADKGLPRYALYELWARADTVSEEPVSNVENHGAAYEPNSRKRKREDEDRIPKEYITDPENLVDEEEMVEDHLPDVIFSQIARNLLKSS